jgi:hypothetical protein
MADNPTPKPLAPIEKNARRLINIMAQYSNGATCEDLNREFQRVTKLQRQSFYDALNFAKKQGWIVGGGQRREYTLNSDGSWREALKPLSVGEPLEKYQLEHLLSLQTERVELLEAANRRLIGSRRTIANGQAAGTAIEALVTIMQDIKVSMRRRIQAAEGLLQYKTPEDIANQAKQFLASVFMDPDQNIDHRLAATTALRKSEDPRIMPAIERPAPRTEELDPAEARRQRAEVFARRKAHLERQAALDAAELERERAAYADADRSSA